MKRFVLNCVLLCLVAGSVMFVSCGDNEIGDSASWLVGTWATSMIMEEINFGVNPTKYNTYIKSYLLNNNTSFTMNYSVKVNFNNT